MLTLVAGIGVVAAILIAAGGGGAEGGVTMLATPQADEAVQANRQDCAQIVATSNFLSEAERAWFAENCSSSQPEAIAIPAPTPEPTPTVIPGSAPGPVNDRMVIKRLGIDARVHTSYVGTSGQMGDPDGAYDVVWYDFSLYGGMGGYPGAGGNAVFAGHVDYHPNIQAVFWTLRSAKEGDVIDYYTAAGDHLVYTVAWRKDAGPEDDFSTFVSQTGQDVLTLITCDGVFNPATRHYDQRSVVRAIRS
jgi:LPXTG-site transpeptidase (sortase) family protein